MAQLIFRVSRRKGVALEYSTVCQFISFAIFIHFCIVYKTGIFQYVRPPLEHISVLTSRSPLGPSHTIWFFSHNISVNWLCCRALIKNRSILEHFCIVLSNSKFYRSLHSLFQTVELSHQTVENIVDFKRAQSLSSPHFYWCLKLQLKYFILIYRRLDILLLVRLVSFFLFIVKNYLKDRFWPNSVRKILCSTEASLDVISS